MAISPKEMKQFDTDELEKLEKAIDEKLKNTVLNKRTIRITMEGNPNLALQDTLRNRYMEAGWTQVGIHVDHEQPGIFFIDFSC